MKTVAAIVSAVTGTAAVACVGLVLYCVYRYYSLAPALRHDSAWKGLGLGAGLAAFVLAVATVAIWEIWEGEG